MALPLKDLTIALSGTFEEPHTSLAKKIKVNGGKHAAKVNNSCTHLVASSKDFESNSTKVSQAATNSDIRIVSIDWLLDSIKAKKKMDEHSYLMSQMTTKTEDSKSKKRVRSESPVEAEEPENEEVEQREPPSKKQKDKQEATSKPLNIPVDEDCDLAGSHTVFVDPDGTIFDASLNQTVSGQNKNKFYRIQILISSSQNEYRTWTRWGRVGETGQHSLLGDGSLEDAKRQFDKKFRDKSGLSWTDRLNPPKKNKYTFIERNYEEDSEEDDDTPDMSNRKDSKTSVVKKEDVEVPKSPDSRLHKSVQNLMKLIFNQQYFAASMMEMSYDANKLPLGKLSKRTLMTGYERLKELAELFANPDLASSVHGTSYHDAVSHLSDAFYTTIPHSFGRNRPPTISNDDRLKKEIELLESLSDMEIANGIMKDAKTKAEQSIQTIHPLDRQYAGLGLQEMTPLESGSNEFRLLEDYLIKSHGSTHYLHMKVQDIFRLERQGEGDRFANSPYAMAKGDRRLLWHGSRCTNFGGILSQGLRIAPPEAPVTGYMFGKGVYLADISSKSANYCCSHSSGDIGLLLLCEAQLGKPMLELTDANSHAGELAKKQGCFSTWGKGQTGPVGWKDAKCVNADLAGVMMPDTSQPPGPSNHAGAYLQYNEYIAYDVAQIRLRYLLRVKMK